MIIAIQQCLTFTFDNGITMKFCVLCISGWWLTYPSEKYEFVTWDDDIPNSMEK